MGLAAGRFLPEMTEKLPIFVIHTDEIVCRAIEKALGAHLAGGRDYQVCTPGQLGRDVHSSHCVALGEAGEVLGARAGVHMALPVRMGALGDRLLRMDKALAACAGPIELPFAGWVLDATHNLLCKEDGSEGDAMRLTEKETAILKILHAASGEAVSREALLDQVWGYVDGVETHTLETHIYRLRQKIEVDPSAPEVLLTCEAGYQLVLGV